LTTSNSLCFGSANETEGAMMADSIDVLICDATPGELASEFARLGVRVTSATNYYTLFSVIEKCQPKIIVGDVGTDLWALEDFTIFFKGKHPSVPVVYYTDAEPEGLRLQLLELGADEVVSRGVIKDYVLDLQRKISVGPDDYADFIVHQSEPPEKRYHSYVPFDAKDLGHVLQFVASNRKTGVLEVSFEQSLLARGKVFVADSRIIHAEYSGLEGLEAITAMMRQGPGKAGLIEGQKPEEETIKMSLDHLLIEASVQADEEDSFHG
jgi:DNA-binding NarL/FixJ family response regulator